MKKIFLVLTVLVSIFIIIIISYFFRYKKEERKGREITFERLLGSYKLDVSKTKLGNYSKDSNIYKNLSIKFNADSTFEMNMKVPFLYDSIGTWKAGNFNEWNWLLFKNFEYHLSNKNSGSQFTRPYIENSKTYFLINGATPQDGADIIQDIYFRKITDFP